jgi:hypothetical protein
MITVQRHSASPPGTESRGYPSAAFLGVTHAESACGCPPDGYRGPRAERLGQGHLARGQLPNQLECELQLPIGGGSASDRTEKVP